MKTKILFSLFTLALGYALISSSGGRATTANSGNTGAPGETGPTCGICHTGGSANFGTVNIQLTVKDPLGVPLTSEYTAGATYSVEVQVSSTMGIPSGYGFQMTALTSANMNAGTWQSPIAGTTIATISLGGGRTYVEHSAPNASGIFQVEWVAPPTGTGDVSFYYAGNAVNVNFINTGDIGSFGAVQTFQEACQMLTITTDSIRMPLCAGDNDGIIFITPNIGTPPFTFNWSNGSTQEDLVSVPAGSYAVTMTDALGCVGIVSSILIQNPQVLNSTITTVDETIVDANDGMATVTASGGTMPYSYLWSNGATDLSLSNLEPGVYTATVTDSNGCTSISTELVLAAIPGRVKNIKSLQSIALVPNPTTGPVQLDLSFDKRVNLLITVSSLVGQVIYEEQIAVDQHLQKQLDFGNVASGMYVLTLRVDDGVTTRKFHVDGK